MYVVQTGLPIANLPMPLPCGGNLFVFDADAPEPLPWRKAREQNSAGQYSSNQSQRQPDSTDTQSPMGKRVRRDGLWRPGWEK